MQHIRPLLRFYNSLSDLTILSTAMESEDVSRDALAARAKKTRERRLTPMPESMVWMEDSNLAVVVEDGHDDLTIET